MLLCMVPCLSGNYIGFDENEPTSRSGGKRKVVAQLKQKHKMLVYFLYSINHVNFHIICSSFQCCNDRRRSHRYGSVSTSCKCVCVCVCVCVCMLSLYVV